jgi:ParB family chromosome partitioning protein
MMYSIERFGQISPVVAVPGQGDQLILIEGYLRVEALRRLGRDTVFAEIWPCKEDEALIRVLAGTQQRHFDAIEQATLIKQLQCRFHCSLSDIARRIGRDLSWVSRRVSLIEALSEDLLDAVLKGRISTWTASRILAPLARANAGHAEALSRCLLAEPLGTRDVAEFYRHYQKANAHKRQKPARAGTARDGSKSGAISEGPEGPTARKRSSGLKRWPRGAMVQGSQSGQGHPGPYAQTTACGDLARAQRTSQIPSGR